MSSNQLRKLVFVSCLIICAVSATFGMNDRIQCGRRKRGTVYLIRNGNDAIVEEWPWHATIFHLKGKKLEYACGGSILDQNTILTAAHCVSGVHGVMQHRQISVQLGRTELKEKQDYTQSHDVEDIVVHPKYNQNSNAHDIALIKVTKNITMSKYVQPVCIWNLNDQEYPIIGKNGTVVGFGLTENDTVSDHLKKGVVSVVDPLTCIQSDRGAFGHLLTSEMICTRGQNGVSACNGDSGGGMFFEINGKWFVRGLVSFTPGRENNSLLCDGHKNTIFTDVAKYKGWITQYVDTRVLHDPNDLIVDYDEKLKLFNFDTCGMVDVGCVFQGLLKGMFLFANEKVCLITLISSWYAIGPARCFPNDSITHEIDFWREKKQIRSVIIHPEFDSTSLANDIALIELLHPVNTTSKATAPICLPVTPEMRIKSFDNLHLVDYPVTYLNSTDCVAKHPFSHSVLQINQFCGEIKTLSRFWFNRDVDGALLYQKRKRGNITQNFFQGVQTLDYSKDLSRVHAFIDINPYMDWILYNMKFIDAEETEKEQSSMGDDFEALKKKPNEKWYMPFIKRRCGIDSTFSYNLVRYPIFPWIGWLHTNRNITIADLNNDAIATLIHTRFALAAAVIMENKEQWRFLTFGVLGSYYSCQTDECDEFIQKVEVREITIHPNYTKSPRRNDIAFIEVWPDIGMTNDFVRPICIPWTEELRRTKPIRLTVSTTNYFWFNQRLLIQENSTSCQRRFLLNGYQIEEKDISICTVYSNNQEPVHIVPGAPLQAEISNDAVGDRQYFLRGLSHDLTDSKRAVGQTNIRNFFMPRLFTDINPVIDWIIEKIERAYDDYARMLRYAVSKDRRRHLKSDQVHLSPIRHTWKISLLDLTTCGSYIPENSLSLTYIIPWFGLIHRTNENGELHKCAVILISAWYGISTASCAVNYTGNVAFSNNGSVHNFPIQKIIVHPEYRAEDLNNNIALIQLAKRAISLVRICLPISHNIRAKGYKRSYLHTFVNRRPYLIEDGYLNLLLYNSIGDRYVDSVYCQMYWNESKNVRKFAKPFEVNSTLCLKHYPQVEHGLKNHGTETEVEGSPMLSVHSYVEGINTIILRGISLKTGTMMYTYASMFYLEIDDFLDWIIDNMNETLNRN